MTVVAHDLPAHHLVEVVLQGHDLPGQAFQAGEGDDADFAVFQGHRVTGMVFGADAVQAQQLAGHLEAGDLVAAVFQQHVGLEETGADGVDGFEGLPGPVQVVAALDLAAGADQFVQLGHLGLVETVGKTQFLQVTVRAGGLDDRQGNFLGAGLLQRHAVPRWAKGVRMVVTCAGRPFGSL